MRSALILTSLWAAAVAAAEPRTLVRAARILDVQKGTWSADQGIAISGGRIELPLPSFPIGDSGGSARGSGAPVELVSIDEVVLRGVEIVSGGRTLKADAA